MNNVVSLIREVEVGRAQAFALAAKERIRAEKNAERAKSNPLFGWYWRGSSRKALQHAEQCESLAHDLDRKLRQLRRGERMIA